MGVANLYVAAILACLTATPVFAACTLPPPPSKIPDGTTATEPEMLAAMRTLKQYDTDVNAYLKCLEFEAKQNRLTRIEQTKKHNDAVETLESVAARFNEQVRLFKTKG